MPLNRKTKQEVLKRDNYKCRYCGAKLDDDTAQFDHILPLSRGGMDDTSNIAACCPTCNTSKANRIIQVLTTPWSKQAAAMWLLAYKKAPAFTTVVSLILAVASLLIGIYTSHRDNLKQEADRKENLTYYSQIAQLDKTENSLKQLLEFVKQQRSTLNAAEDSLLSLKSEKEKLKPLVDSDRQVVDALFRAQEERNQSSVSKERWIGFGLGVLASFLASTVMMVVKYFLQKRRKNA